LIKKHQERSHLGQRLIAKPEECVEATSVNVLRKRVRKKLILGYDKAYLRETRGDRL
jgi:hypothetical protein